MNRALTAPDEAVAGFLAGQEAAVGHHADTAQRLRTSGYAVLAAAALEALCGLDARACDQAAAYWNALPPDTYLKDGGHYRSRRHASYIHKLHAAEGENALVLAPHRAHYQPTTYNALHGGMLRWYAPFDAELLASPCLAALLSGLGRLFASLRPQRQWFVEAHQFRIDTHEGIGRPTPEGAHRDGVDFVAVILVQRHGIRGGETRVFQADGPHGVRFTLEQPWSALLMDDSRVIHESTPIQPTDPTRPGWRDTLVLTWRAGGFLEPGQG